MSMSPVLEVAVLQINPDESAAFETAITRAFYYLQQTPGYISHQCHHCLEQPERYLLTIQWESLDAHLVNFRESDNFVQWRGLIGSFFTEVPQILHYQKIGE